MRKKVLCSVGAVLLILGISGCAAKTIDEMYALPRMSERNSNLRASIENSMEGRGYAAPLSGSNQESVQTADLNGDGKEEYLILPSLPRVRNCKFWCSASLRTATMACWRPLTARAPLLSRCSMPVWTIPPAVS